MTHPRAERAQALRAALESTAERLTGLQRAHAQVVEAARGANADDEHDPEGATIAFERAQVAALITQAVATRERLLVALEQVERGEAVSCRVCGGPIDPQRLAARPESVTCIDCARNAGRPRR